MLHILIVQNTTIPAKDYGGTERVIWWLGKELVNLGHEVSYLVPEGSYCPFAKRVLKLNSQQSIEEQIPDDIDIVHLQFQISHPLRKPYVITHHGNYDPGPFDLNTIFVSRNHALRNDSESFVFNGIDPDEYGPVDFNMKRSYLLFLAYAKRLEKNLRGSIEIAFKSNEKLAVLGGRRRFDQNGLAWWVKYYGMIGGQRKNQLLNSSKSLLFPVLWHEPFGIAIVEAMYFGMPVFATNYGSLPDLVTKETGFLSNSISELVQAVKNADHYNRRNIHSYVCSQFGSKKMTQEYLKKYDIVLNGKTLNQKPPKQIDNHFKGELLPTMP